MSCNLYYLFVMSLDYDTTRFGFCMFELIFSGGSSNTTFSYDPFAILDAARRHIAQHGSALLYLGELHRQMGFREGKRGWHLVTKSR